MLFGLFFFLTIDRRFEKLLYQEEPKGLEEVPEKRVNKTTLLCRVIHIDQFPG